MTRRVVSPDRFSAPLYSVAEAALYVGVPDSTMRRWVRGSPDGGAGQLPAIGEPVVTSVPARTARGPVIPFVGLAEGLVLAAMRSSGVPLQRIRPALSRLSENLGVTHALASRRLFTDGAEVLLDYAESTDDAAAARAARELVVVRSGQRVFNEVVEGYLRRLEFDSDGVVRLIRLPAYKVAEVVVDPTRGFGQPVFAQGGARLEDALAMFRAGERLQTVADEYGMPPEQVEGAVRVATLTAA